MINLYLSGPMYLGKEQATTWRKEVIDYLNDWTYEKNLPGRGHVGFNFYDPCARWHEKGEKLSKMGSYVVQMDKMEIAKCSVVLVNATDPGWGTPMEQYIAYETGKMVIAFSDCDFPSIWAIAHSHRMFRTHILAANFLCSIALHLDRIS